MRSNLLICDDMRRLQDMLDFCFDIRLFLEISEHVQTSSQSSIKESDQERQRKAEEVEDLRKQLAKKAAEACLHLEESQQLFFYRCRA